MIFKKLKHKLLFGAVAVSLLVALACMLAVSWVIRQQHLSQSHTLLLRASHIIEANLAERNSNLLAASRQLATQKNIGSTIWYLGKYAHSGFDRATLLNTYQQLARDVHEIGRVAKVSRVAIYDGDGHLVAFALFDQDSRRVGFVERTPQAVFRVSTLRGSEALGRDSPFMAAAVAGVEPEYGGALPREATVHYEERAGMIESESYVPVMDDAFDPNTRKLATRQVGVVVMSQILDHAFIDRLSGLTDTRINIFTAQGLSIGQVAAYQRPDPNMRPANANLPSTEKNTFNEIATDGGYYQSLMQLYSDKQQVGAISALYSKRIVRQYTYEMLGTLGAITLGSLVLIFPLAWFAAASISKPLTLLSGIFRGVASGKQTGALNEKLGKLKHQLSREDELGDLTQSFIVMNDAINQKIAQINEINASLEATVNARTAALAEREQESRMLLENTPDTIARYDAECRRVYANSALGALVQGGVAALIGSTPSEIPGGENSKIYETKVREVFATGQDAQFELVWPSKSGRKTHSHIRVTAERDMYGKVVSVLAVGRDITELHDSRAELGRKELAKTRFLAAAGHDLRQPLAAANLFIDALKTTSPTHRQNEIIARLDQAMQTFNGLLDALLNISKLDAGIVKPEYGAINVTELFVWLEQNFEPLAREKNIGFKLHFPVNEEIFVRSDLGLIKSALMNFVSNAVKFTVTGAVLVSARRRGDRMLFQVWDTGIGIREEDRKYIFEEFYQINNPQRDRTNGLGLGLSIAKRALNLLDTKVTCSSRFGRGSVFGFQLPLDHVLRRAGREIPMPTAQAHIGIELFVQGKHFVVVEDDKMVSQAIAVLLEGAGGKVACFHRAEDAMREVDIAQENYFIVDFMLGGEINGIEILNQFRQRTGKPIHAVLVTGDTSPAFIGAAANFAWPVLHKPVDITKLIAGLRTTDVAQ